MITTASPGRRHTAPLLYGETAELPERVPPCARLFDLVALQPSAAATRNRATVLSLPQERARAARENRGAKPGTDAVRAPDEAPAESRALQPALDVPDDRSERELRLRDRIGALQDASLPLLRSLPVRPRRMARAG